MLANVFIILPLPFHFSFSLKFALFLLWQNSKFTFLGQLSQIQWAFRHYFLHHFLFKKIVSYSYIGSVPLFRLSLGAPISNMLGHSCQTSVVIIFYLHLLFYLSVLFSFLFLVPLFLVALDPLLLSLQFSDCLAFLFPWVFLSWVNFYFIVFCDLSISILNFWILVSGLFFNLRLLWVIFDSFWSVLLQVSSISWLASLVCFCLSHLPKSLILIFSASLVTLYGFSTPFPVRDYLHIKNNLLTYYFYLHFFLVDLSYLLMSF